MGRDGDASRKTVHPEINLLAKIRTPPHAITQTQLVCAGFGIHEIIGFKGTGEFPDPSRKMRNIAHPLLGLAWARFDPQNDEFRCAAVRWPIQKGKRQLEA